MKKKLICYLLALGLLSSSMVVNASSLPNESTEAEETAEGESPEAETAQPVQEEEKDGTQEPDGLAEETPDEPTEPETVAEPVETVEPEEAVAQETQQKPVDEQQEESGDDIQETPQEEGLLGDQILVSGGDDQNSATVISLNTEYAGQKKSCWYKFTTKSEPAYYELWMRNNATEGFWYHIYSKRR